MIKRCGLETEYSRARADACSCLNQKRCCGGRRTATAYSTFGNPRNDCVRTIRRRQRRCRTALWLSADIATSATGRPVRIAARPIRRGCGSDRATDPTGGRACRVGRVLSRLVRPVPGAQTAAVQSARTEWRRPSTQFRRTEWDRSRRRRPLCSAKTSARATSSIDERSDAVGDQTWSAHADANDAMRSSETFPTVFASMS